ncbi:hypothetical protein JOC95_002398 [Bacillus tianshenii]|uniref:Uncharacterized protein n=1 Tax=Sutcliffiella tianshenii TaxID=1463404 RepID=A0ABS2P0R3_9BACI|nr:hypothetical protein [Bacillus tianshenii]
MHLFLLYFFPVYHHLYIERSKFKGLSKYRGSYTKIKKSTIHTYGD